MQGKAARTVHSGAGATRTGREQLMAALVRTAYFSVPPQVEPGVA